MLIFSPISYWKSHNSLKKKKTNEITGPSCVYKWSFLNILRFFLVKKNPRKQKAYLHIKMEPSFATSEFYEKCFFHILCPCIFFLNNKVVYKKEHKQFVTWPVVFLAPGGQGLVLRLGKTMQENLRELLPVMFLVCAINHLHERREHSLFNFEIVFEIVAVY